MAAALILVGVPMAFVIAVVIAMHGPGSVGAVPAGALIAWLLIFVYGIVRYARNLEDGEQRGTAWRGRSKRRASENSLAAAAMAGHVLHEAKLVSTYRRNRTIACRDT